MARCNPQLSALAGGQGSMCCFLCCWPQEVPRVFLEAPELTTSCLELCRCLSVLHRPAWSQVLQKYLPSYGHQGRVMSSKPWGGVGVSTDVLSSQVLLSDETEPRGHCILEAVKERGLQKLLQECSAHWNL